MTSGTNDDASAGPNLHPEARTAADEEAIGPTCRYLGETFRQGELICFQGNEWRCSGGSWVRTGRPCDQ